MNTKKTRISILGCGWLGLALGEELFKQQYEVLGSTTSESKFPLFLQKNIKPFLINLSPEVFLGDYQTFFDTEILIICFPPRLRSLEGDSYLEKIESIARQFESSKVNKVIFISSTSIYPAANRKMAEKDANGEHVMFSAEKIIQNKLSSLHKKYLILRLSGLMGYDRIPCKYYEGKEMMNSKTPVNYIHRDDVIAIIVKILKNNKWNEIYNVVAPLHPLRKKLMKDCSKRMKFDLPHFRDQESAFKIILGDKLTKALNYKYLYPDPLKFKYLKSR